MTDSRGDRFSRLGRGAPRAAVVSWSAIVAFTAALVLGSSRGQMWTAAALVLGLMLVGLVYAYPTLGPMVTVAALLVLSTVDVVPSMLPTEVNYAAHAAALVLGTGGAMLLRRRRFPLPLYAGFLLWLLVTGFLTSSRIAVEPSYSPFVIPGLMLGTVLVVSSSTVAEQKYFARSLILLAAVESAIGLSQTVVGWPTLVGVGGPILFEGPRNYLAVVVPAVPQMVRMATGTYSHFNALGALLAMALPLCLAGWRASKSRWNGAVLVAVAAGLVATFSRGALIGGAIGCLIVVSVSIRTRDQRIRRVVWTSALVLAVVALWNTVTEYATTTQNLSGRVETWRIASTFALRDPLALAIGYGQSFFARYLTFVRGYPDRLHSALLQLVLETGLVGLTLFVVAVGASLRRALRMPGWLYAGAGASVVAFLVHQMVDNSLVAYNGVWFSGLAAIGATALGLQVTQEADAL